MLDEMNKESVEGEDDQCMSGEQVLSNEQETNEELTDEVLDKLSELRVSESEARDESDDEDDGRSIAASTIMDPKLVRSKVQKSLQQRIKKEKRRIRNKGESAFLTQRNRENVESINDCYV